MNTKRPLLALSKARMILRRKRHVSAWMNKG